MSYSKLNNGVFNGNKGYFSKLDKYQVDKIRTMTEYKEKRINDIDAEINRLKIEREKLRYDYSQNQIALDFNVTPITIRRIQKGESW